MIFLVILLVLSLFTFSEQVNMAMNITGLIVLAVVIILAAAVTVFCYYKKRPVRAVTPAISRPDSVAAFKREWRDYAEENDVIENPGQ